MHRLRTTAICLSVILLCAIVLWPTTSAQQSASVIGQWSTLMTWSNKAVHTILLPTGQVLFWPSFALGDNPQLYNPATMTVTPTTQAGYNPFCGGHSFFANGQLFVTGGDQVTGVGLATASTYDPVSSTWTLDPDMNEGRWYPSNTTLANSDVLVVAGEVSPTAGDDTLPQVFQYASGTWRNLTSAQLLQPTYPEMYLLANGTVFNPGPEQLTRFLNTQGAGAWSLGPSSNFGYRDYGPSAMYDNGKILLVGGGDPPTATAETIDLTVANPTFSYTSSMTYPRRQANATILADGKILVTGGSCGAGFDNADCPVYPAEMWDPATGNWTVMASISVYRGYHSTAVLLPDGSVFSGGGALASGEIFYPPYLFAGARPSITSTPATINPGSTFFVGVDAADVANITAVNLIRLGATTHTFNMEQRLSHLSFTQTSGGLNVTAPATNNIVPPGPYMLFVLNGDVPSVASLLSVNATGTASIPSIALSAEFLSFGTDVVGSATANSVTVSNVGTASIAITNAALQGSNFTLTSNNCPASLAAGAACTIGLSFKAPSSGPFTGSLVLTDSDPSSPQTVTLSGIGTALQVSSTKLTFPTTLVGSTSAVLPLTLTNIGTTTAIALNSFAYSATQFAESTAGTTCGASLAPTASCILATTFTPSANGSQFGTLTISDSDPGGPSSVALVGSGGSVSFSPAGFGFGNTTVNTVSPSLSTTITNLGTSALSFTSFTFAGTNASDFTIQSNTCTSPVAPGGTCVVTITFETAILGLQSATIAFVDSAGTQTLNLTGTGVPALTSIAVTPANPSISAGATEQFTATGTYSDNSTQNLTSSANWSSSSVSVATVSTATKGLVNGLTGGTSTIKASYKAISGTTVLTVTAAGVPSLTFSPTGLGFGSTTINAVSPPLTITLTNPGGATLNISNIAFGGANPGDFTMQSNTCGAQLTAGANCAITIVFETSVLGAQSATLVVSDNAGTGTQTANLIGSGKPSLVSIAVTPANPGIAPGATEQFTATGTYSDNSTQNLTSSVNWYTSNASVATVSTTTKGLYAGVAAGTSTVKASYNTISGTTVLTVTAAAVPSLTFSPTGLGFGSTTINAVSPPLTITLSNPGGATLNISSIAFGGANPGDFTMQSNTCGAQLTAGANCAITIVFETSVLGAQSATLVVSDNAGTGTQTANLTGSGKPSLVSIAVTPANPSISAGATEQFVATGTYSDNSTQNLTSSVNWYTSNAKVATLSTTTKGLYTGVASGTTTIKASYNAIFGTTVLTVQ